MIDGQRIKQRAQRIRPLLLPLVLYIGFLALAVARVPGMESSFWRYTLALLPMAPGLFLTLGILRAVASLDEMERRILLEAAAFGFILTLILLLSVGLLGLAGMEQPSPVIISAVMCFLLLIGKLLGNRRYR